MNNKKEKDPAGNSGNVEKVKTFVRETKEKYYDWKRKRRQKRYEKGEVDLPVFRVGPNKKGIAALWLLMISSLAFGVYKNFTAIDRETIYETTVVEARVTDTNAVESFVERFAYVYHAWDNSYNDKSERLTALSNYMTEVLVSVNNNAVNSDCPTISEVEHVRICEVTELGDGEYSVRYLVRQKLTEAGSTEEAASLSRKEVPVVATGTENSGETTEQEEGFSGTQTGETAEDIRTEEEEPETAGEVATSQQEEYGQETASQGQTITISTTTVQDESGTTVITTRESYYLVTVHVDDTGAMVVIKNPTACGIPGKSAYAPVEHQSDSDIDAAIKAEIEEFLNTFFTLYPAATEKELAYYAKPGTMDVINADFVYGGLSNTVYYRENDQMKVHVYVKYLDQTAKMTQISEYTLTLEKGDNWKIVNAE